MPRIRFTAQPKLPRDLAHLDYQQGTEVELSDDQADRWIRRGVAVVVDEAPTAPRRRLGRRTTETEAAGADVPADGAAETTEPAEN